MHVHVGLISDSHGVFDPAVSTVLKGVQLLLHAGDVGHHGGHEGVLKAYAEATGVPVLAVSGNVDDGPDARHILPPHRLIDVAGWRLLVVHIVAPGPGSPVDPASAALIAQHRPHLVVCGHSHKPCAWCADGVAFVNPGSAGPARFKPKRTVASLQLPVKPDGDEVQLALDVQSAAGVASKGASRDGIRPHQQLGVRQPSLDTAAASGGEGGHTGRSGAIQVATVCYHELAAKAPPRLQASKAGKAVAMSVCE